MIYTAYLIVLLNVCKFILFVGYFDRYAAAVKRLIRW